MKDRSFTFNLAVSITVTLLTSAGILIVLGICDESLGWDIFSPTVEKFLYAIFGSIVALSVIGVAITLVLGANESVRTHHLLLASIAKVPIADNQIRSSRPIVLMGLASVGLVLLILLLGLTNSFVQKGRFQIFRQVASDQASAFQAKLVAELEFIQSPPTKNVPQRLFDYLKAMDGMTIFNRATIYMQDPVDRDVLWGYTAWRAEYSAEDGFARFYPVKPFEKALLAAFNGNSVPLEQLNKKDVFEWYSVLSSVAGEPIGILRIDGNPSENYRAYLAD